MGYLSGLNLKNMIINSDNDNVRILISTVPVFFFAGTVFKGAGSGTGCHWDVANCKLQNARKISKSRLRASQNHVTLVCNSTCSAKRTSATLHISGTAN